MCRCVQSVKIVLQQLQHMLECTHAIFVHCWIREEVSLEVEGEGDGDDDVGIGDSANKSENHFYRLHHSNCHLVGACMQL